MLRWFSSFTDSGPLATAVAISALIGGISLAGILVVWGVSEIGGDDTSTVTQVAPGATLPGGTTVPGGGTIPGTPAPGGTQTTPVPPTSTTPTETTPTTPPPPTRTTPPPSPSPFGGGGIPGGVGSGGGP